MPKIDPVTGCKVMTLPEFLNAEGEKEGKSGADVWDEIVTSLREDEDAETARMRDPAYALSILQSECGRDVRDWAKQRHLRHGKWMRVLQAWDRHHNPIYRRIRVTDTVVREAIMQRPVYPVAVLEVIQAGATTSLRSSTQSLICRVRCDDGARRIVFFVRSYHAGTQLDPPDEDVTLEVWTEKQLAKWQALVKRGSRRVANIINAHRPPDPVKSLFERVRAQYPHVAPDKSRFKVERIGEGHEWRILTQRWGESGTYDDTTTVDDCDNEEEAAAAWCKVVQQNMDVEGVS